MSSGMGLAEVEPIGCLAVGAPRTGEHCPVSGWWAPDGYPTEKRLVTEGNVMPSHRGQAVLWMLMRCQLPVRPEQRRLCGNAKLN